MEEDTLQSNAEASSLWFKVQDLFHQLNTFTTKTRLTLLRRE